MNFLHRKLFEEPEPPMVPNVTTIVCNTICIEVKIQGNCPIECFSFCPEICKPNPISNKTPNSHKPSTFLIVSLCLLVATFLFVCCFVLYRKYYSPRTRRSFLDPPVEEENRDDDRVLDRDHEFNDHHQVLFHPIWYINTVGLQPSIINSITICKYKKGEGLIEGTDCSVCLSEFEEDETLRLLPKCSHAFHLPCIDTWLRSHTNCPLCRAPIVVKNVVTSIPQPEEEIQVMILENSNSEFGEQRANDEVPELRIRIEQEQEQVERVNQEEVRRIEPTRRSVSLDSLSASKINASLSSFLERVSDGSSSKVQISEVNKTKKIQRQKGSSSSKGRSNRNIGPVSMKRSLSSEGICRQIQHHDSSRPLKSF